MAIIGGAALAQANGLFQALAVNALNALLGSVDAPGGLSFMPQAAIGRRVRSRSRLRGPCAPVAADILAVEKSPVQVLLLDGVNPVFATPPGWRVREAVLKVPFVVSFGSFIDDTSALADLILPDHSVLESWTDARPESGAERRAGDGGGPGHEAAASDAGDTRRAAGRGEEAQAAPQTRIAVDRRSTRCLQAQIGEDGWATATKQGWVELKAQG